MRGNWRLWILPLTIIVTGVALARFPLADCFDCEGTGAWGRNEAAYQLRSEVYLGWLLVAPFILGFARIPFGWTVPFVMSVIDCLTQHYFGGVPWWSLENNEGPFILLFDTCVSFVAMSVGAGARLALTQLNKRNIETNQPSPTKPITIG